MKKLRDIPKQFDDPLFSTYTVIDEWELEIEGRKRKCPKAKNSKR